MNLFPNIISDPEILNGKPCIRDTRISVELIMDWLGTGGTPESIAEKHPKLTKELVMEAIRYAARYLILALSILSHLFLLVKMKEEK
ncbi:MAG: DUF433 domain-containing protein [Phaeodactylibacter sp.]|nr:DUF433 domain-containing protein [Phaeodactylibacter sp.]